MRRVLADPGASDRRLARVCEPMIPRIGADEFSPPAVSPGEGQLRARGSAVALCREAFPAP